MWLSLSRDERCFAVVEVQLHQRAETGIRNRHGDLFQRRDHILDTPPSKSIRKGMMAILCRRFEVLDVGCVKGGKAYCWQITVCSYNLALPLALDSILPRCRLYGIIGERVSSSTTWKRIFWENGEHARVQPPNCQLRLYREASSTDVWSS